MNTRHQTIISLYKANFSMGDIGKKFNISRQRVWTIITGYKPIPRRFKGKKELLKKECRDCGGKTQHIHHNDENPINNKKSNLVPLCRKCHLKRHGMSTYSDKDILKIKKLFNEGLWPGEIREKTKLSKYSISTIIKREKLKYNSLHFGT